MEFYNIAVILHLLAAIMFIGFIFADVVVFPALNKKFGDEQAQTIKETIYNRGVKIYPVAVMVLFATGGIMFSKYINSSVGFFDTGLQQLLWLKFALVMVIVIGVLYALSCRFRNVPTAGFMKHFHKIALVLGFLIVLLAKAMFLV